MQKIFLSVSKSSTPSSSTTSGAAMNLSSTLLDQLSAAEAKQAEIDKMLDELKATETESESEQTA